MGLKRTVPPDENQLVLDLQTLRTHLRLPPGDGSLDDELRRLIGAVGELFEEATWRALLTQTWRLTLCKFPCEIIVPRPPLVADSVVIEYVDDNGDLQTLDPAMYYVASESEPARIAPAHGETWPSTRPQREAVRVTFASGYGGTAESVPKLYRDAMLLIAADRFRHREANSEVSLSAVPMGAAWILSGAKVEPDASWFNLAD